MGANDGDFQAWEPTSMGRVMSPRIALLALDGEGAASFGEIVNGRRWWSRREACSVGDYPAFEFRHPADDVIVVLVRVVSRQLPDGRQGALVVVWVVADTRTGASSWLADFAQDLTAANVLIKHWACEIVDGVFVSPALASDNTQVGTAVKNSWPANWRVRLETDLAESQPTGARCLGVVIA
jgi:hypothetical protein